MRQRELFCLYRISEFQFTHPGKGATCRQESPCTHRSSFNSRTLGRVRLYANISPKCSFRFQFTHPGKGATKWSAESERCMKFQFTHPGKGATAIPKAPSLSSSLFQFTHPGKGATQFLLVGNELQRLFQFTHPGKGATLASDVLPYMRDVSIHAPWEGCDRSRFPAFAS